MVQSSNLTTIEKEIALASIEKWVRDYSVNELTVLMAGLIMITHANCGQKEDAQNIDLTIDELVADLKKYNPNISFQEIQIAFKNGYKGVYGEYFGLNNKTYFSWINAFTWSTERKRAKEILKPIPAKTELSDAEKERKIRILCLWAFRSFKRTGKVIDAGNVKYDYLHKVGAINFTKERRSEFKEQAQNKMRVEALESKQSAKGFFAIRDAIKNIEDANNPDSLKVVAEAKRIALCTFFQELIETGTELKELMP